MGLTALIGTKEVTQRQHGTHTRTRLRRVPGSRSSGGFSGCSDHSDSPGAGFRGGRVPSDPSLGVSGRAGPGRPVEPTVDSVDGRGSGTPSVSSSFGFGRAQRRRGFSRRRVREKTPVPRCTGHTAVASSRLRGTHPNDAEQPPLLFRSMDCVRWHQLQHAVRTEYSNHRVDIYVYVSIKK